MSIVKKISVDNLSGSSEEKDIGADAINVSYSEEESVKDKLDQHEEHTSSSVINEDGVHGLRIHDNILQSYDETEEEWSPVSTGYDVPAGGATNQGLVKASAEDNDTTWADVLLKNGSVAADNITIGSRRSDVTTGLESLTMGPNNAAAGRGAQAQGASNNASGNYSHAEGQSSSASGVAAHAEGSYTVATGSASHAEGDHTEAGYAGQHVTGKYNDNKEDTLFEVGNGTLDNARSNAFEVTNDGYIRTHNNSTKIAFGVDANNKYGYIKDGESSVTPFDEIENITELEDVSISSVADKQGLVYDSTSSKWQNKAVLLKDGSVAADNLTIGTRKSGSSVGTYSVAEGRNTTASGGYSHVEGQDTTASGSVSHAEGYNTKATNYCSHAEGYGTTASGNFSHTEGQNTTASGNYSHAEGGDTKSENQGCHAEGSGTTASGPQSHAEGQSTIASGSDSHAEGFRTIAGYDCNHAQGHYNKDMSSGSISGTAGNAMVIGNGIYGTTSNAFRVTFAGQVYGLSAFNSSGADYAEFFEWEDGNEENEDRVGYFVTLSGDKIKKATAGDYILGIISGQPSIIGNGDEDWLGRWQRDDFGRFVWGEIEEEDSTTKEKQKVRTILPNPDYDPEQKYIERKDRPEWDCVGMLGALAVRDNGECKVNGFCQCGDGGIAVPAESGYRVIKRVSDNVIKIIFSL